MNAVGTRPNEPEGAIHANWDRIATPDGRMDIINAVVALVEIHKGPLSDSDKNEARKEAEKDIAFAIKSNLASSEYIGILLRGLNPAVAAE